MCSLGQQSFAYLKPPQSLTDTLWRCCDLSYFPMLEHVFCSPEVSRDIQSMRYINIYLGDYFWAPAWITYPSGEPSHQPSICKNIRSDQITSLAGAEKVTLTDSALICVLFFPCLSYSIYVNLDRSVGCLLWQLTLTFVRQGHKQYWFERYQMFFFLSSNEDDNDDSHVSFIHIHTHYMKRLTRASAREREREKRRRSRGASICKRHNFVTQVSEKIGWRRSGTSRDIFNTKDG